MVARWMGMGLGLALAWSAPAGAEVLFANFAPSDTAVTDINNAWPIERRLPDASQSFDTGYAVGSTFSGGGIFHYGFTEFVAPEDFLAADVILPLKFLSVFESQRIGVVVQRYNTATSEWVGAGSGQFQSTNIKVGATAPVVEARIVFGTNATNLYQHYAYQPISFDGGERYRLRVGHGTGSIGLVNWYLSDEAAGAAQTYRTRTGQATTYLPQQFAFAFTDGGSLAAQDDPPPPPPPPPGAVPEPGTWGLLILGFGLAGAAIRRRARAVAAG